MKRVITPGTIPTKDLHQYIIGAVAPRPIAFVSTVDEHGVQNIAPYSFFNAFSSNPPILVFSSNRRVVDNTTKDTLANIKVNGELVINMVNFDIVQQMSIASAEYPHQISEWDKSGLTQEAASIVRPSRVKESPVNIECKVKDIIALGEEGGAGHLIICEVLLMHIAEAVLDGDRIDPHKIDLMGRMGRTYYIRASGSAVHSIYQPVKDLPVGFDSLPTFISHNPHLSGNEIGKIAALQALPELNYDFESYKNKSEADAIKAVKLLLADGKIDHAFQILSFHYMQGR